jgi:hypothetical protein
MTPEEREYLDKAAIAAMQGLLACSMPGVDGTTEQYARKSYELARAMLAERRRLENDNG